MPICPILLLSSRVDTASSTVSLPWALLPVVGKPFEPHDCSIGSLGLIPVQVNRVGTMRLYILCPQTKASTTSNVQLRHIRTRLQLLPPNRQRQPWSNFSAWSSTFCYHILGEPQSFSDSGPVQLSNLGLCRPLHRRARGQFGFFPRSKSTFEKSITVCCQPARHRQIDDS